MVDWVCLVVWVYRTCGDTLYAVLVLDEVICMTVCQLMMLLVMLAGLSLPEVCLLKIHTAALHRDLGIYYFKNQQWP